MRRQAYQHPELRDENDNIIQSGAYGKKTVLTSANNDGGLDYINNNLEWLYDALTEAKEYVATESALPVSGAEGKVYVAEDTGTWYVWDGAKYVAMNSSTQAAIDAAASAAAADASEKHAAASENAARKSEESANSAATAAKASETNAAASAKAAKDAAATVDKKSETVNTQLTEAQKLATGTSNVQFSHDSEGYLIITTTLND